MKVRLVMALLLVLVVGAVVWQVSGRRPAPAAFHGTFFEPPMDVPDFRLQSVSGAFGRRDLAGRLAVLFFGFTHCPHICPTTLSRIARALQPLGEERDQVKVVMITVDPVRDTSAVLDAYVKKFDPAFIGLSGSDEDVRQVSSGFGIFYQKTHGEPADNPTIDHTSAVTVLGRDGRARLLWNGTVTSAQMTDDLRSLLRSF